MDGQLSNTVINNYIAKAKAAKMELMTAEGRAFLLENAKKKGVVSLPSGLQYKIIKEGNGAIPIDGQTVKTNYKGSLINGKQFDSSYDRGQPATFGVNQVIAGWTEALKLMPVGSQWELYIPYNLAYGERAMGANIPAYSTLIFTIELLEIVK
jgi:FKBP-type peptidyl-prolyl cis-trans isomerase FklB